MGVPVTATTSEARRFRLLDPDFLTDPYSTYAWLRDDSPVHHEGLAEVSADGRVGVDVLHEPGRGREWGKFALRVTELTTSKARRIPLDMRPCHRVR